MSHPTDEAQVTTHHEGENQEQELAKVGLELEEVNVQKIQMADYNKEGEPQSTNEVAVQKEVHGLNIEGAADV